MKSPRSPSPRRLVKTSKFLSLVLRHDPARIGLTLDEGGWARIDELVERAESHGTKLTRQLVLDIVESSDKQRFALSEDGRRIRANQGHSIEVDLGLPAVEPPEVLFHGTAAHQVEAIRRQGLERRKRQHVHLSPDEATAVRVGQRHGRPVVLRIRSREMHEQGHVFMLSDNGVWLAHAVPAEFIDFPSQ